MISRSIRSRDILTLPKIIQHDSSNALDLDVYNWTFLLNEKNHQIEKQDVDNIKVSASVLSTILSNILEERTENELKIITDLDSNDLFFSELTSKLSKYFHTNYKDNRNKFETISEIKEQISEG